MPALDIFNDNAFSVQSLTKAINDTPYQPMLISDLGLFSEEGITTTMLSIERMGTTLSLVPASQRGAPGIPVSNDKRTLYPISTVHLKKSGAVIADEVQNVRAFGTESELETVQNVVNRKLAKMRRDLDVTIEYQRIGAIKGQVLDADGSTVILDLNTVFGTTQQVFDMVLDNDATKVKAKVTAATRLLETALGGLMHRGLLALCGKTFFDTFVGHPSIEKAYDRWLDGAFLRETQRAQNNSAMGFSIAGVTWREYNASVGGNAFIGDNDAYLIPMGVPDLFVTNFAPADYMETVNTVGVPYYAKQKLMDMDRGVMLEGQSNPISICTRPNAIIKLTV